MKLTAAAAPETTSTCVRGMMGIALLFRNGR
jgi:hypothetical protein